MNKMKFVVHIFLTICSMHFGIFNVSASDIVKRSPNLKNPEYSNSFDKQNIVRYIGAVLEYEPFDQWSEDGKGYAITKKNAETFVKYAEKAKSYNADIIITPEYGLQSLTMSNYGIENSITFTQYVPDPSLRNVVCDQDHNEKYEAIKILSCGARTNEIYIVVDLAEFSPCSDTAIDLSLPWSYEIQENCPNEGYFIYNTQVVFDRKGAVVARYRKQHLYAEPLFTPGPQNDDEAVFITDFNVVFSLQICFDILFEHPGFANIKNYGIRDVAMATAWVDILPFYLANGVQNGWSRNLGVNLLVSGYHKPEKSKLGSGIYNEYSKDYLPLYTFDENSGNVLLISTVETIAASSLAFPDRENQKGNLNNTPELIDVRVSLKDSNNLNISKRNHLFYYEDLSQYSKVLIEKSNSEELSNSTICSQGNFCCTLSYKYSGNQTYYFLVLNGNITLGGGRHTLGMQSCAIIWCQNSDFETCGHIESYSPVSDSFLYLEISSNSFSADIVYPIQNHRNTSLISNEHLDFITQDKYSSVKSVKLIDNLFTVALQGRIFPESN